jgi:hypothetical protein
LDDAYRLARQGRNAAGAIVAAGQQLLCEFGMNMNRDLRHDELLTLTNSATATLSVVWSGRGRRADHVMAETMAQPGRLCNRELAAVVGHFD